VKRISKQAKVLAFIHAKYSLEAGYYETELTQEAVEYCNREIAKLGYDLNELPANAGDLLDALNPK